MKKIILLMMCVFLAWGHAQAQLPEISTASDPVWYFIQIKGNGAEREDRVFTAETDTYGKERVNGRAINTASMDNQLWRFEKNGDNYVIFSKAYEGKKINLEANVPTGTNKENLDAATLSATPATDWIITLNSTRPGYANIQAVTYSNNNKYLHLTSNYNQRDYPVMGNTPIDDDNSVYRFIKKEMLSVSPATIDFSSEYVGYSNQLSKAQTIAVVKDPSISEEISYTSSLEGFIVNGENLADKGVITVTFAPTEIKAYSGVINITVGSYSQTVTVSGSGIATPVIPGSPEISNNTKEVWYYVKSLRAGDTKVIRDVNDATVQLRFQEPVTEDGSQLWKATGDLNGYAFTSILGNSWYAENTTTSTKIYATKTATQFTIEAYDANNNYIQSKIQGTATNYINISNDNDRLLGTWNTSLGYNDGGAPIAFVLADEGVYADQTQIDFGIKAQGETFDESLIKITGVNLGEGKVISHTITGPDAVSFSNNEINWSNVYGGTIEIEFAPTTAKIYNAVLEINYTGGATKTISLTGEVASSPILFSDKTVYDFGLIALNITSDKGSVAISGAALQGDIEYQLTGTDASSFSIDNSSWTAATGGILDVTFTPASAGAKTASIEITSQGADPLKINLTGEGENILAFSTEDNSNETWYYIQNARGGGVFTDMGAGKELDCLPAIEAYEGQLWKLVGKNTSSFRLVNQSGNQISYTNTYLTGSTSSITYALDQSSYAYAGYENVFAIKDKTSNNYIEKRNNTTGYTRWTAVNSDGAAVVFLLPAEIATTPDPISTGSAEKWYSINFNRATGGKVVQENETGTLTQVAMENGVPANTQLFKFTGNIGEMKIISYSGKAFFMDGNDMKTVEPISSGDTFKFEMYAGTWRIKNSKAATNGHNYVHDNGGNSVMHYTMGDGGSAITITPWVMETVWNGSENTNWDNRTNWTGGVPAEYTNVTIAGSAANAPVIPEATTIAGLSFEEGAQADLQGSLTVTGKIHVEKTVNPGVWYPVGFPYAIEGAYHYSDVDGFDEFPFLNPYDGTAQSDYWVRSYNGTTFDDATAYATGEGRIVQFPTYFTDKTITFVSDANQTITNATVTPEENVYKLVANPTLKEMEVTSENGVYYYKYDGTNFNLIKESQSDVILPFEAFIVVKDPATLRSIIGGEDGYTSIDTVINRGEDGDEITGTRYYNLQGIEINKPTEESADKGAYIRKDIYKSGKESTSKVINIKK